MQIATNWIVGLSLIGLGLIHNLAGGPLVGRWLQSSSPPLQVRETVMGRVGFEFGGYLAVAIGLSFIVLGSSLPKSYYLFWSVSLAIVGAISLYSFKSFHISQFVWLLALLLGAYYAKVA